MSKFDDALKEYQDSSFAEEAAQQKLDAAVDVVSKLRADFRATVERANAARDELCSEALKSGYTGKVVITFEQPGNGDEDDADGEV